MGVLATAALEAGGLVIGVEPQMFVEREFQLEDVIELIVTKDMPQRKAKMLELGDAFIAMPGGTGTLGGGFGSHFPHSTCAVERAVHTVHLERFLR